MSGIQLAPGPAAAQLDPLQLAPGDSWTWTCRYCPAVTQGGRGGHDAHMATVHPDQAASR